MTITDLKLTAKSWGVALLHSAEARLVRALQWCDRAIATAKVRLAAYEQRAVARLHADDLKAALKALHEHVQDLEKRAYIDETAVAQRARQLLAKLEGKAASAPAPERQS